LFPDDGLTQGNVALTSFLYAQSLQMSSARSPKPNTQNTQLATVAHIYMYTQNTYIHLYIHRTHTHPFTYTHAPMYTQHTHTHPFTYAQNTHSHLHICTEHTHTYITYICTHTYIHVYAEHTHTHTHLHIHTTHTYIYYIYLHTHTHAHTHSSAGHHGFRLLPRLRPPNPAAALALHRNTRSSSAASGRSIVGRRCNRAHRPSHGRPPFGLHYLLSVHREREGRPERKKEREREQ